MPGCGHDLRGPEPPAGRYGGKGENEAFSLVAPPCDPVSASPSVPKAELLLEHEDAGRTGRRVVLFVVGPTCIFPFSPLLSMTFPLCPPGGGKGPVMGALPPFEAPFQTPESPPPCLALSLSVRCPPVPTKASLSEQAGAYIHPRMGGGMKSGQGCYPSCVPRPAVGGIAGAV